MILAKPETKTCNLSMKSRIFLDLRKLAKLKPIFQKESRMNSSNYRPMQSIPLILKIFEKTVRDQMMVYIA